MKKAVFTFIPGEPRRNPLPLARFLPPLHQGLAAGWLRQQDYPSGSWLLDPFGASPDLPVEAARAGMRVLVAANNPVIAFIIEVLCASPTAGDLQAAISDLAAARKGDERLEAHIASFYLVHCQGCGAEVPARAFIWNQTASAPDVCLVDCSVCGFSGEQPVPSEALDRLKAIPAGGLHLARAIERVAAAGDPIRPNVELAVGTYLNRSLYVLTTLINKVDGMAVSPPRRRLLKALLLSLCDEANSLWPYPVTRNRPKQITRPPRFRENNLWLALENAAANWSASQAPVPVTTYPDLPPESGGVCLFPGRIKELAPLLAEINPQAVLTVLPRPNQAFWTLSAVWSGWLFGREAASGFHTALTRQRYDWQWYTTALHNSLAILVKHLKAEVPCLTLLPETEPAFLSSVFTAAGLSGWVLEGLAFRHDEELAQFLWQIPDPLVKSVNLRTDKAETIRAALANHIAASAEPAPYLTLQAVILAGLTRQGMLVDRPVTPPQAFADVQKIIQDTFTDRLLLSRTTDRQLTPEKSLWRTASLKAQSVPLADRVEMTIVNHLQKNPVCRLLDIDTLVCQTYPGLLTPDTSLVKACLDSYTDPEAGQPEIRRLRPNELASVRRADLAEIQADLVRLGEEMGFKASGDVPILWAEPDGDVQYVFYVTGSAVISQHVLINRYPPDRSLLVMPGSRAGLFALKRRRNPYLAEFLAQGWRVVKYRQVRRIAQMPAVTRSTLDDLINGDPLEEGMVQIPFFTSREEY